MDRERHIFLLCVTEQICKIVPRVSLFSQSWKQSQILESKRCIFKLNLFSYRYWGKTLSDNNFDMLVFIETTKFLELFFSTGCAWIHKPTNSHAHQILYCQQKTYFLGNISLVVVGEKGYFMMLEGRSVCSESRVLLWYLTTRFAMLTRCVKYHNTLDSEYTDLPSNIIK